MKKIFTLIASVCITTASFAQDVVELSFATADKTNSTNAEWFFSNTNISMIPSGGNRDINKGGVERTDGTTSWANGLNFKNNAKNVIKLPEGTSLYRIEFSGFSQGDNWTYLYAYGFGDAAGGYEWADPIGSGVKDNKVIHETAKFPLDPCMKTEVNGNYSFATPGYKFAEIDFGNEPYTGEFPFIFSGNNQESAAITLYLSRAAADNPTSGIENIINNTADENAPIYNVFGQRVDESYKGIVIKNGKKYINR